MSSRRWIRTCQECGLKQATKPTPEYVGDSWQDKRCKRCKSAALDYGHWEQEEQEEEEWDSFSI